MACTLLLRASTWSTAWVGTSLCLSALWRAGGLDGGRSVAGMEGAAGPVVKSNTGSPTGGCNCTEVRSALGGGGAASLSAVLWAEQACSTSLTTWT